MPVDRSGKMMLLIQAKLKDGSSKVYKALGYLFIEKEMVCDMTEVESIAGHK